MSLHHWFFKFLTAVIILQFFCLLNANAQEEKYAVLPLTGKNNQIAKDSSSTVQDTVFYNLSLRPTQTTNSVKNLITFKIDEFANIPIPDSFKVTITFKVYYSKLVGATVVQDSSALQTVFVENNIYRPYQSKAVYNFTGGYKSQVKIFSVVTNLGTFSAFKDVLMLENEITVNRDYAFDPNVNTIQSINGILGSLTDADSCSSKGEFMVSWGKVNVINEYDLEWAYIDSSAVSNYYITSTTTFDPVKIFRNNATRVSITRENYQVPLLYDNGGILFYRVRPVKIRRSGQRVEGKWSSAYASGLGQYGFSGHERNLNWQASTSYAEEGKRKSVVQYFDGTLRNRQTVTKDNNTCYTIVAESMYDYQGRPVIQVMPAPTLNRLIGYIPNFNRVNSANAYDKTVYDNDAAPGADNCSATLPGMDVSSGASQYYSGSNPQINSGFNKYIPDAHLYPFAETRYTPDNTGRISMQGGVGKEFQVNDASSDGYAHHTQYFYGSADQEELDALFGTEAGNASHYSKNMVRDANGQYSVSYVDMHGRTIATALAGKPVAKLDSLQSGNYKLITKKLLDTTNNLISGTSVIATKTLLVTRAGLHRFQYSLSADSISLKDCNNNSICYDCLYDLEITVSNDCSNPNNQPILITRTSLQNFVDTLCSPLSSFPALDTSISLSEGSYTITKKLTISPAATSKYNEIFLRRNTCKTLQQFIDTERVSLLSKIQCTPTCQTCTDSLGSVESFRSRYMLNNNIPPSDSASFREQALAAYTDRQAACNALCANTGEHTSIRQQMLADMTPPFGQYAELDSAADPMNIFYVNAFNIFRFKRMLIGVFYKNDYGLPDSILNSAGQKVPPTDKSVTAADFKNNFKPSWAETLLPLHPEYCKLLVMESYADSYTWDERFGKVDTYKDAVDSGFLNPANFSPRSTLPATANFNPPAANAQDPFFTRLATNSLVAFQDSMINFFKSYSPAISAWSAATIGAHCAPNDVGCAALYMPLANAFTLDTSCRGELDFAWRYFRELYLQKKLQKLDEIYTSCPTGSLQSWHTLNFSNINILAPGNGLPITAQATADSLTAFLDANSRSYVTQWLDEMKPCNLTMGDTALLLPRLIAVCRAGADSSHLYGSSTTKPGTYTTGFYKDSSFIQVFKSVLGSRYDSTCNAYLITAPQPYDRQPGYGDIELSTKPDSCQCSKITNFYTQYQSAGSIGSFADFIYKKVGVRMYPGVLDTLRQLCSGQLTCAYLATPVVLPPALQCNVGGACANCTLVSDVFNKFKSSFPNIVPAYNSTDSVQINRNKLFENFMNYNLGFSKTTSEYLTFMDTCGIAIANNPPSNTCPAPTGVTYDSLYNIYARFKSIYPNFERVYYGTIAPDPNDNNTFYWDIKGKNHLDASGGDTTFWRIDQGGFNHTQSFRMADFISNGILKVPDYDSTTWKPNFNLPKRFCVNNGFTIAMRVKSKIDSVRYRAYPQNKIFYDQMYYEGSFDSAYFYFLSNQGDSASSLWSYQGNSFGGYTYHYDNTLAARYNDWRIVKLQAKNGIFTISIDDTVRSQHAYSKPITFLSWSDVTCSGHDLQLDWWRVYDNDSTVLYDQEFTSLENKPLVSVECLPACDTLFMQYFNQQLKTNYTYSQINCIYLNQANISVSPCVSNTNNNSPLLCGSPKATFESVDFPQLTPCADSTLFSVGTGTKLYNVYQDSITGAFNNRYLDKCLKVRYTESFTVSAPVSEFHYTLYYYDQAGNLVKTVPPAGVDVSNFSNTTAYSTTIKNARALNQLVTPAHVLATQYRYNTLNQVVVQITPDAGISQFWYDRLGRLVVSQNAKQKANSGTELNALYSYTNYDYLGRIAEVGQIKNTSATALVTNVLTRNQGNLTAWLTARNTVKSQQTQTVYDLKYAGFVGQENNTIWQRNLRNRVSYTSFTDTANLSGYNQATFYTYDIHGNVDTLLQDYGNSATAGVTNVMNIQTTNANRWKRMVYQYDLISGKVNHVAYQPQRGSTFYPDRFYHRYSYDAENRLITVETSMDSVVWEKEARYEYYLHGPLARTTLGAQLVQGTDYAYTLQGWLKGINGINLQNSANDMGRDASIGAPNQYVGHDVFAFNLNYFAGDYAAISGAIAFPGHSAYMPNPADNRPLYNGNISSMATASVNFPGATAEKQPQLCNYSYDQLNRITGMDVYRCTTLNTNSWSGMVATGDFKERMAYDANGNIVKYLRQGFGSNLPMDSLSYNYTYNSGKLVNNKLNYVTDQINGTTAHSTNYTDDIEDQAAGNYVYDRIGNLIADTKEGVTNITWNVYGKIKQVQRTATATNLVTNIKYTYDAGGNRISKQVTKSAADSVEYTWYVRDASGNIMTTYFAKGAPNGTIASTTASLLLTGQTMYGSSRLGVVNRNVDVKPLFTNSNLINFTRGNKFFELTNHLGNVMETISDKKTGVTTNGTSIDYYYSEVITANDYYSFGSQMPGRQYKLNANSYRYGFNGKENDNDVKGDGNQQDYGMRIYDPRLGRFLSVDPISDEYPQLTPYQFASNRPIDGIDRDGLEWEEYGRPVSKIMEYEDHLRKTDPKHADEIIGQHKLNAFITVGSMLSAGSGVALKAIGYTWAFYQTQRVIGVMNKPAASPEQKKENFEELKAAGADIFVGLGTGKIVGGVFKLLKPLKSINVDLMGGPTSIEKGSINFDPKAVAGGINDEVKNFSKYFGKSTVSNITVNNPQANFLEEVVNSLKPGGTITVRGTLSNKFFKTVYNGKAQGLEGFTVTEMNPTRTTGMNRTSGEPIQGEIKELQLIKK